MTLAGSSASAGPMIRLPVLMLVLVSAPASAQTQAQQDRLEQLGRYTVTAPMCGKLGMTLAPDIETAIEPAVKAETATWGLPSSIVDRLSGEAVARQSAMLKTDLEAASAAAKTAEQLRGVKAIFLRHGETCLGASSDPLFSRFVQRPAGYDLDRAATAAADSLLEAGGLASWQTPLIQARGDLLMLAGACRHRIGPVRSDDLVKTFGRSDDPRERSYYSHAFDEGLSDTELRALDLTQCNRAILRYRQQIARLSAR